MSRIFIAGVIMMGFLFGASDGVKVGSAAPDFNLTDQDGKQHKLSEYKGQKVVVYFYPKDDTPGCTKEACSIRDDYKLFAENGIQVFGLSYDGVKSHKAFAEKYNLPFTLLSDSSKSVSKAYGTYGMFVASRKTFLINEQGIIFKIYDKVDVTAHGADILEDFRALLKK